MDRVKVPTPSPYAKTVGYSRAVRAGNHVFVAGTASVADDGSVFAPGDPYRQTKRCLEIIVAALEEVGAGVDDVVRTRMFVKSREMWQEVGRAHGEIFAQIQPAATMVFADFIAEEMVVEIEVDAVVDG